VDRIMSFFDDDATFLMARGPEPNGRRVHGKAAIRKVLADRFKVISGMRSAATRSSPRHLLEDRRAEGPALARSEVLTYSSVITNSVIKSLRHDFSGSQGGPYY
jgi:hypothetical protein